MAIDFLGLGEILAGWREHAALGIAPAPVDLVADADRALEGTDRSQLAPPARIALEDAGRLCELVELLGVPFARVRLSLRRPQGIDLGALLAAADTSRPFDLPDLGGWRRGVSVGSPAW